MDSTTVVERCFLARALRWLSSDIGEKDCLPGVGFIASQVIRLSNYTGRFFPAGMNQSTRLGPFSFPYYVAKFGQAYFGDGSRFGQEDTPNRKSNRSMASNALPAKRDRLFALCDDMCDGLTAHETPVGVKQNTEAVMRPALAAARATEAAYGQCQVLRKTANATLTSADSAGKVFLGNARKRLTKFLGETYSLEWGAAGWPNNSTAVPDSQDERFNLIVSLQAYFTAHPAHESVDMDATAALADAKHTAISNARIRAIYPDEVVFTVAVLGLVAMTVSAVVYGRQADATLVAAFVGLLGLPVFMASSRKEEP